MVGRLASLLLAGVLLVAHQHSAAAEIEIVTTLPDLAAIAAEVGGEHVSVRALANPRQDPHYVDPRPSYIVMLNRANLLIINGLELEIGWLPPLLTQARNPEVNVGGTGYLDASAHVSLLGAPQGRVTRDMGDVHPGGNPHFTFSPLAAIEVAAAVRDRLAELDPDNTSAYADNAARFTASLQAFAEVQHARFAELLDRQRRVVPYHQSTIYLTTWLGLEEIDHVEPVPGTPPSPGHVAQVLSTMRANATSVVIQEEFYPTNTSRTLAELAGGELVVFPGGTRFDQGQSYLEHVQEIADALYAVLSREY